VGLGNGEQTQRVFNMQVTIDLSEQNAATLEAQARAARMSTERYLAYILERVLDLQHRRAAEQLEQHLDYMASQVAQEITPEEIEVALEEALAHVRPHRIWQA